jgi:hypothetical protein
MLGIECCWIYAEFSVFEGATMFIRSKQCVIFVIAGAVAILLFGGAAHAVCPYDFNCLNNPYGAGSPYKPDGMMNPYSQYGSPYSNNSWTNPYATNPPKIYDQNGQYHGNLSTNPYDPNSVSNPYGRYGSPYSPDSLNNPYGAGNPYSTNRYYVVPQR